MRPFLALPALLACSLACEAPAPAAPAKPAEAHKQPEDAARTADTKVPAEPAGAREELDLQALLARKSAELKESRELATAYAEGTLGDRLAAGELLLIDARPPHDADQVRYFVFGRELAELPKNTTEARKLKAADGPRARASQLGGEDAGRPAIIREIEAGTYTACVVVGPPATQEQKDYQAKAEAAYIAEVGDNPRKIDPLKMQVIAARITAETGYAPPTIDWDKYPLRCRQIEVTADAASRVVVLGE